MCKGKNWDEGDGRFGSLRYDAHMRFNMYLCVLEHACTEELVGVVASVLVCCMFLFVCVSHV